MSRVTEATAAPPERGRTAAPPAVPDPRRWAGLAVLTASLLVVVMDMTILNVALPDLSADLRPGAVAQLWIVDSYALVLAGLLVPLSALADRWGRRRMLLLGFTVFAVVSMLVLVADSAGQVIALRSALGIGGAMIMPATMSLIRTLFTDPRERATALGLWAAMAAVGGAVGPIVGGALLERFSWHAAFLFNVPLMVVAIVAGRLLLPESRSSRPGRIDALGVLLSVTGMVAFVYAIKELGHDGVGVVGVTTALVGVALLAIFVRRCLHAADPMLQVRLFTQRQFTAGIVTALTTSAAIIALLLVGAQWLQLVQGWSPLRAGAALLPLALGGTIGSPLAPALAQRIGARTVLVGGLVSGGLGFLVLGVLPAPLGYPGVAVALLLVGTGTASLGVASAVVMGSSTADQAGSAAAIEETAYEIGGVLGVAVLGSLASIAYRAGLPAGAPADARESLAGALDTPVAAQAMAAFDRSFSVVGFSGAAVMLVVAVVVHRLVPAELDLAHVKH